MSAALEGGEGSAARPGRTLPPGKTRYPFYRRLGGPQGRSGRAENLVPTGIRSRIVQPVVSRYTDWATRPTLSILKCDNVVFGVLWFNNVPYEYRRIGVDDIYTVIEMADFERIREVAFFGWSSSNGYS